jgi:uncharacterized damage-inducible protein DinB
MSDRHGLLARPGLHNQTCVSGVAGAELGTLVGAVAVDPVAGVAVVGVVLAALDELELHPAAITAQQPTITSATCRFIGPSLPSVFDARLPEPRSTIRDMPDQKPPRLVSGERETVLALLQYQRESFVRKAGGISDDEARRALVPSGTTLLWLMKHMAHAESLWIEHRFAGRDISGVDSTVQPADTLAAAAAAYRATWTRVDAIIAASELDELCRDVGNEAPVNLRWVLMHVLEETARHAGHADILRELSDGDTGR